MIDSITISRECAQIAHSALDELLGDSDLPNDDSPRFLAAQELARALWHAASPPSSAMREALENIIDMTENCAGVPTDPSSLPQMVLHVARAALSADDGWVIVDEEHPLPDDLREGDWIRASLVRLRDVEGRIGKTDHSDKIQYRYLCEDEWLPDEAITAYRRAQKPSQGMVTEKGEK